MPHLRFRSIKEEDVSKLSKELPKKLAEAMNTTVDNFTFELISTTYFQDGSPTKSYPFVEILWFDRGQETQDKSALVITGELKKISQEDIVLVFTSLEKNKYYENGTHF